MSKQSVIFIIVVSLVAACIGTLAHLMRYRWKYKDPVRRRAALAREQHLAQVTVKPRLLMLTFYFALVLTAWGGSYIERLIPGGSGLGMLIVCVGGVGVFVGNRIRQRRVKDFRRDLAEKEYRTCPNCFYSLEGSPDEGRCPECGQHYNPGSLINDWSETIREHSK